MITWVFNCLDLRYQGSTVLALSWFSWFDFVCQALGFHKLTLSVADVKTEIKKSEYPRPDVPAGDGEGDVSQQSAVQGVPQVIPTCAA